MTKPNQDFHSYSNKPANKLSVPETLTDQQRHKLTLRIIKLHYLAPVIELTLQDLSSEPTWSTVQITMNKSMWSAVECVNVFQNAASNKDFALSFINFARIVQAEGFVVEQLAKELGNSFTNTAEYQAWNNNFKNFIFELRMAGFLPYEHGQDMAMLLETAS